MNGLAQSRRPFRFQLRIGLVLAACLGAVFEPVAIKPAESPNRGAAHQQRFILEQSLGLVRKIRVAGIADRDQHVADETRAADALDRAFGKQRAECTIVESGEIGKPQCRRP